MSTMITRRAFIKGVAAKTVIIATGAYGRVYWIRTSNPYSSTGDGIVAGMNIGIPFKDPEMVQFHPTGLSANGVLLSESSRAEGALLVNKDGEHFMVKYAPEFIWTSRTYPSNVFLSGRDRCTTFRADSQAWTLRRNLF